MAHEIEVGALATEPGGRLRRGTGFVAEQENPMPMLRRTPQEQRNDRRAGDGLWQRIAQQARGPNERRVSGEHQIGFEQNPAKLDVVSRLEMEIAIRNHDVTRLGLGDHGFNPPDGRGCGDVVERHAEDRDRPGDSVERRYHRPFAGNHYYRRMRVRHMD